MTPWSEESKRNSNVIKLLVLLIAVSVIFEQVASNNGGKKVILLCTKYALSVIINRDFHGIDYKAFVYGIATLCVFVFSLIVAVYLFFNEPKKPYGDARFATKSDLKQMGLTDKGNASGIIVGKVGNRFLSPPHLRHGIVLAPTRSGKTAGFVIPSALSFKGSLIITDPKGELEGLLAEPLRKTGKTVYSIDWSKADSKNAWNPLSLKVFPSVATQYSVAERQAERIAAMLVGQKGETSDHWETNAKKHIAAMILLAVHLGERSLKKLDLTDKESVRDFELFHEPHLSTVFRLISKDVNPSYILSSNGAALNSAKENLRDLLDFAAKFDAPPRVLTDLAVWVNAPDNEAGSHMTTFLSKLQIWRSKAVFGATRECSFDWQDLRDTPSAVFIKFPQEDAQSLGVLTSLFFESLFSWTLSREKRSREAPIAILADEFGSLPKINSMTDFLSKGAGMGSVIWLIVQDLAQIKAVYGDKLYETVKTNCSYLLTYAQNNVNTQKELSTMTGKTTQKRFGKSRSAKGETSTSENAEGVDLINVSDWGAIPFGHHVLLCQGFMNRPVFCKTPLYFKEKQFTELLNG